MKYAFTLKGSSLRVPLSGNGDLFQLPRHMVTNRSWKGIYSLMKRHAGKISPGKKAVRIQV
jgi:hypothetical protein